MAIKKQKHTNDPAHTMSECRKCGGDGMVLGPIAHSKVPCVDCGGSGFFLVKTVDEGKKCHRCFLRPCACRAERDYENEEREQHDRY